MKAESGKRKAEGGLFLRHERCLGLRLWKWGRTQWILWFAPKGAEIEDHVHRYVSASIAMLAGSMAWRIEERWPKMKTRICTGSFRPKFHEVPAWFAHGATALQDSLFLVRETWLGNEPMTSAATDFHKV